MSGKKRSRDGHEEEGTNGKDHMACDQCRIKKIRCDKERPQCSNCSRLDMYCEWSGHGKKPNQTVLLHQSIATFGGRLERIEGRLTGIYQTLQQLVPHYAARPHGSRPETDSGYVPGVSPSNLLGITPAGTPQPPQQPPALHHIARGPHGYERYFGPTSLMSLLHNFDRLPLLGNSSGGSGQITSAASAAPDPASATLVTLSTAGPLAEAAENVRRLASLHRAQQAAPDVKTDDRAMVKEPSMLILVGLVDAYFQLCNPHLPIWTRAGFAKLVDEAQENAETAHSMSFAMCANNLVLLTLIARVLHGHAASSRRSHGTIDAEVIQSYVENASRAIFHVGQLLEPRLVNVQALLSLCAVAQVCLTEEVFSLALTLANQVAKSMGLHQSQGWSSEMSPEELEERRNVLYCLYCLDKAVSWNHGSSPSVGSTAGSLAGLTGLQPSANQAGGGGDTHYMSARFALAQIDDSLYASLYQPDPAAAAAATQCFEGRFGKPDLQGFEARLGHWRRMYELDGHDAGDWAAAADENGPGCRLSYTSRLDLDISCNLTHMQLLSRFVDDLDVCSALLEDGRSCLASLERLWAATSDPGHCSSFARLISSFPPSVVCRLAFQAADSEAPASRDLALLDFLAKSLRTMASMFATRDSYTSKLSAFVDIMVRFVRDSHQDSEQRQQPVPSRHAYSPAGKQQQQQSVKAQQTGRSAYGFGKAYQDSPSSKKHSPEGEGEGEGEPLQVRNRDVGASAGGLGPEAADASCIDIDVDKGVATGLSMFPSDGNDGVHDGYRNGGDLESLMELWNHQKGSAPMVFGELDTWGIDAEQWQR